MTASTQRTKTAPVLRPKNLEEVVELSQSLQKLEFPVDLGHNKFDSKYESDLLYLNTHDQRGEYWEATYGAC